MWLVTLAVNTLPVIEKYYKPLILGAGLLAAFATGWTVNGDRWAAKYLGMQVKVEQAQQKAVFIAQQKVDAINKGTQEREQVLQAQLFAAQQQTEDLRHAISNVAVIKHSVASKPVVQSNGDLVCPPAPSVDWGVFRDLYNRAADPSTEARSAGSSDGTVSSGTADTAGRP